MVIKELLETVIKSMVDEQDKIQLIETKGDKITTFELTVDNSDIGKILGKKGKNITAIRTILNAASTKLKRKVVFEFIIDKK